MDDVLSSSKLSRLFTPSVVDSNRIKGREGKTIEYKQSYNHSGMAQYFKTMAAFANTDGGYLIFGIGDRPREFIGLSKKSRNQFDSLKIEVFTNNLNEYFQPEIQWKHTLFKYKGKYYGVLYTYALDNKPCICTKNIDSTNKHYTLKDGDIYYRYHGRTQRIRYTELQNILNEKSENQLHLWMNLLKKTAKVGIENATVLDLKRGEIPTGKSKIILDENLLKQIHFVKEGSFVEKDGDPTLRLIGDVTGVVPQKYVLTTPKLVAIEQQDIIKSFLKEKSIESPFEYIKVIFNCSSGFQPIYYYLHKCNYTTKDILAYIKKENINNRTVNLLSERLKHRRKEYRILKNTNSPAYKAKNYYLKKWLQLDILEDIDVYFDNRNSIWLMESFFSIPDNVLYKNRFEYKKILLALYKKLYVNSKGNIASSFRKAVCRIDEVIYFTENRPQ